MTLDDGDQRRIRRYTDGALQRAGVAGILPTPLHEVMRITGQVDELLDISEVPDDLRADMPSSIRKLLGAIFFPAKTVFVDQSQAAPRERWTQAHEAGHAILPWHKEIAYFDDSHRLLDNTHLHVEHEANAAAAHLMFQGREFIRRATAYELSLATPLLLADDFGASYHATIRYFAEHHPDPVALVIAGSMVRASGYVPIWQILESPAWRTTYGPASTLFPERVLPVRSRPSGLEALADVAKAGNSGIEAKDVVALPDALPAPTRAQVEAFTNTRCLFMLLSPARRIPMGRRIRVAS